MASVSARTEVTLVTEGAAAALPDHAGPEIAESLTIGSVAGWEATERPPAVQGLPLQPKGNFNYINVQPDFITSPLMIDGVDCLRPDAGTGSVHHSEWMPKLMSGGFAFTNPAISPRFTEESMPVYVLSAPQNGTAPRRPSTEQLLGAPVRNGSLAGVNVNIKMYSIIMYAKPFCFSGILDVAKNVYV